MVAPATDRIAFASDRDGDLDIYVMNADVVPLVTQPLVDYLRGEDRS